MSIYRVLLQPSAKAINISDDDSLMIKEKFSCFACLLPPIWAMAHNLWVELALFVAAMIGLSFLSPLIGDEASFWLYVIGAIWIGFEASAILAKAKMRKGFTSQGDIIAQNDEESQIAWVKYRIRLQDFENNKQLQDQEK